MSGSEFSLPKLSRWHKKVFLAHAQQVLESQQVMASKGKNVLHYTLKKKHKYERMTHYPLGDRIDKATGGQYFYHCHRENFESTEHGHYHCFLRYKNIPKSLRPAPLSDWDRYMENPMTHLVAIAMNQFGQPIRLFTVNRWVTSEIWYSAPQILKLLRRFKMCLADDPYWKVLDKWIEGMLRLFAPQIIWLQHARDKLIADYQVQQGVVNPYLDENLEELSEITIDLKQQIEWILS